MMMSLGVNGKLVLETSHRHGPKTEIQTLHFWAICYVFSTVDLTGNGE